MQGHSLRPLLNGKTPSDWQQLAYHRYGMHRDAIHNAYAHYGIRTQRYKLVYGYNQGFDLPGAHTGGEAPEREFFDCQRDPLELLNCHADPEYAEAVAELTRLLEAKMAEIGDDPAHLTQAKA